MYGRLESEGQEQCCRIAVCTDITGHEQTKNGHQRKHLNILNLIHFQSRFFFHLSTCTRAKKADLT